MTDLKDHIFREYDIRGVYGVDLTAQVAETLGRAYPAYFRKKTGAFPSTVTVGMDVRLSSKALCEALIKGLTESGVTAIDLGHCPTPLEYFSLHTLPVDGGIMITGSHNPPQYNGFKVSVGTETIYGAEIQKLKEIMKKGGKARAQKGKTQSLDIISKYIAWHCERAEIKPVKKPLRVVLDAGNGAAGLVAPALLRKLGCEVVELFCEPDGRFPNHHPDPTVVENLAALMERVRSVAAAFGVGYDGDADRIGVVDENGSVVWGDMLMVVFAREMLKKKKGLTFVGEVKCSQTMYDEIEKLGGCAVMWKTGHSLIKSKMKELDAALSGEMSGHIFFADRYFGFDDAIYATVRLVEIMADKRQETTDFAFSGLLHGIPRTFSTPEIRIDCPDSEKFRVVEELKETVRKSRELEIKDIIDIDGVRIAVDGGWALVRASNTQPVLVLRYEAESPELLEKLKGFVAARLRGVWPRWRE